MTFLTDREISAKINGANPLSPDCVSTSGIDGRVKAGSLDLTVGNIYVPGKKRGELGAHDNPMRELSLGQGETAIVRTLETVALPADMGGIAFPPASASLAGMLTTNPGHLDPGYSGHLHLTIINMGRVPIKLKMRERIVRVLFYQMSGPALNPYQSGQGSGPIDENLLASLSHDFLNVNERAENVANKIVEKTQHFLSFKVPLYAAIVGLLGTILSGVFVNSQTAPLEERISKMEGRLSGLGADVNLDGVENRLEEIEKKLDK